MASNLLAKQQSQQIGRQQFVKSLSSFPEIKGLPRAKSSLWQGVAANSIMLKAAYLFQQLATSSQRFHSAFLLILATKVGILTLLNAGSGEAGNAKMVTLSRKDW